MKKIICIILICTSLTLGERPLNAQKQVVLASMEPAYKLLRIVWHCVRIGASLLHFDYIKKYISENPYIVTPSHLMDLVTNRKQSTGEIFSLGSVGVVGFTTLQNGIMGLKRELWDRKK